MTRLVLYATLGAVLSALGFEWDTWQFLCVMALFVCSDYLSREQGYELGVVMGMTAYSRATEQQRADLDKIIKDNG